MITTTERVKQLLWSAHEAAMDAANDPSQANIRRFQDLVRQMERNLPAHYHDQTNETNIKMRAIAEGVSK